MSFFSDYRKFRGQRVITCPETNEGAAVSVDALHAAASGELRLSDCSRWPERAGCDQACLSQIASAPADCLVQSIVTSWYAGKKCVCCGRAIGKIVWHEAPPAVRMPDGKSCEWKDIAPQDLPRTFSAGQPLCWYCNNVEELIRTRPDLVTQRHRPSEQQQPLLPGKGVY